ncbi:hypothetical protein [Pseudoalteromonas sp. S16_S37]|uniref:hypothetical protein n=1 Tax=Pseudoalteromonas sp. S16_S37 TaxID=2720228 RepID=UPI0016809BD0|nr:hypothetical protein [Pseudoalteromonas sp. S16_S37]MBD1584932.1 hypothetical protein [Pseudoalteromonas sp. S16_S37]
MTTPVTVYRWDDEGAPQINQAYGTGSEIRAVLNACLVDGYGAKQPLGWTKVHDNINGVVYQNNTEIGSGGMVRFWPKGLDWEQSLSSNPMLFQGAKTFIDTETPFHAGYTQALKHPVSSSSESEQKAWVIIGTGYAFYLIMGWVDELKNNTHAKYKMISGTNYNFSMFCGDIHSRLNGDAGKFIAFCDSLSANTESTSWSNTLDYMTKDLDSGYLNNYPNIWDADNTDAYRPYAPRKTFNVIKKEMVEIENDIIGYAPVPLMSIVTLRQDSANK